MSRGETQIGGKGAVREKNSGGTWSRREWHVGRPGENTELGIFDELKEETL